MKPILTVAAMFMAITSISALVACSPASPAEPRSDEEIASQIATAYTPAKSCWDSFRDASCPDVLATVKESLQAPYQELQKQGGREASVRELASVQSGWDEWLKLCMDDVDAVRNSSYCLSEAPGSADLDRAIELVKSGA